MNIFYKILLKLAYHRFFVSYFRKSDVLTADRVKKATDLMRVVLHNDYWCNLSDEDKIIVRKMLKIRLKHGDSNGKNQKHDFNKQILAIKNSDFPNIFTIFCIYRNISKIMVAEKLDSYDAYNYEPTSTVLKLLDNEMVRLIKTLGGYNGILTRCKQAIIFQRVMNNF